MLFVLNGHVILESVDYPTDEFTDKYLSDLNVFCMFS